MNFAKMIRYGFHPRGLHSLVGEAGPHTTQYNTCHVAIKAINIKKARVRGSGSHWQKVRLHGGRIKSRRENSVLLTWEMFTALKDIRT